MQQFTLSICLLLMRSAELLPTTRMAVLLGRHEVNPIPAKAYLADMVF
jgi:hypothetical protein